VILFKIIVVYFRLD